MEEFVEKIKEFVKFKDTLAIGDVVLVLAEETQEPIYAYVCGVERDSARKDEWWHVELSFLSLPIQKATWTLRTDQMTGMEIFTMGGKKRFVKAVDFAIEMEPEMKKTSTKSGVLRRLK